MSAIGWDIGGANLKQATADGRAWSVAFELWRRPDELPQALADLLALAPDGEQLAVTMTGELADCFATKAEGVSRILAAADRAAGHRKLAVWSTAGKFLSVDEARAIPLTVAAANWHALATWAGRLVEMEPVFRPATSHVITDRPKSGLLIDIGSTTTDVIPIFNGRPCSRGLTDVARLQAGELIYTGVRRTPLCALASTMLWRNREIPVAAELFATTVDVYLLTGDLAENERDCSTANGRPATIDAAHDRLARMLCCDREELPRDEAHDLAGQWAAKQQQTIAQAIRQVAERLPSLCSSIVLSGSGEFLARRVLDDLPEFARIPRISLTERLGRSAAEAACAYAVANLLSESSRDAALML